jgi:hypothetical protein
MKQIIFFLIIVTFSNWTYRYPEAENRNFLASDTKKDWQLVRSTPEPELNSCKPLGSVLYDNTWTFFADGSFEFDHGAITQDPDCMEEGCCTDLVNIIGSWSFTENGTMIKVMFLHEKDNPSNTLNEEFFSAEIDILDENTLQISLTDKITGEKQSYEFSVK